MADSSPPKSPDPGYRIACVLLPLSIICYLASLTMNVARVEGHVIINNDGINQMLKEKAAGEIPLDEVSDEISGLIRDYVWKKKQSVPGLIADQIDISDISRIMNKEVKARSQPLVDQLLPSLELEIPNPEPEVREVKLLQTIRDLFTGTEETERDLFLAVCILLFTIVFPLSKYLALGLVIVPGQRDRGRVLDWLKNWGQWSMGDVFVVAFMVTFLKLNTTVFSTSSLAEIKVHVSVLNGMYLFGAAIILSMIASMLLTRHAREAASTPA